MGKITFMGAGSTVFAKNVLGDVMLTPALCEFESALYDIDVKSRNRGETTNSVNEQNEKSPKYFYSDFFCFECVNKCLKHYNTSAVPPAFSIFSLAVAENLLA